MSRPKKITVTPPEDDTKLNAPIEPADEIVNQKEDTIEIKKSDFDKMINQLEKNAKDIELLYKASDKSRMAKAAGSNPENLIKKVRIWTWDNTGKIVIATKLITNRAEVARGQWIEDQTINVVLEDGEVMTVPYLEFARKTVNKILADIIKTTKTTDDNNKEVVIYKVQFDNGKTIEINSSFVN